VADPPRRVNGLRPDRVALETNGTGRRNGCALV